MTTSTLTAQDRDAFYSAALLGLRALDARERTPRRFGADAAARWSQFAGALGHCDRLDILLRDAAGAYGADAPLGFVRIVLEIHNRAHGTAYAPSSASPSGDARTTV